MGPEGAPRLARWRPWLELVRLPQVFAAAADALAGALVAGAGGSKLIALVLVALAAGALSAGDSVVLDWANERQDRLRRPGRPLASGRIGRLRALLTALVLLATGGSLAAAAHPAAGQVALATIACIGLGRFIVPHVPAAYLLDAARRPLNLLMGMTLVSIAGSPVSGGFRFYVLLSAGFYALGVLLLDEAEVHRYRSRRLGAIAGAILAGALAVAALPILRPGTGAGLAGTIWSAALVGIAGYRLGQAVLTPSGTTVTAAREAGTTGGVLQDAAAVACLGRPWASLLVAVLLPLTIRRMWALKP